MAPKLVFTLVAFIFLVLPPAQGLRADQLASNPIVFVTMVPNPTDFGTLPATFGNHLARPDTAFRGGDLWIRYSDGTLKNLTAAAGFGTTGFQGANAIAVRDPSVSWDGTKVLFSMVIGAPTQRYQLTNHRWQLYEVTGLGTNETPVITKVLNQPSSYNNISPIYLSDDSILFSSDRPRDNSILHTYPQRDEYESSPVTTGLWKLNPGTGDLTILDHSPSGDFNPIVDSFGRVVFTRWDHLQRDQQNIGASLGAFNYVSETSLTPTTSAAEIFPEPRSQFDLDRKTNVNLFTLNQFFPWAMNQDGTDLETLNHIGRQEIGVYSERSFNDDPNVEEFYSQYPTGANQRDFTIFLQIKEDPIVPGRYFGISCPEFGTHASGQVITIDGAPGVNPDAMVVNYLTHPDTAAATDSPSINHTGLYRDPLPLSNGNLIASHTVETREDDNIGTSSNPLSRYQYRLKLLTKPGAYYAPATLLTPGITKSINFWSPDELITYSGTLWEVMAVEVKSRTRPPAPTLSLPSIEAGVLNGLGVSTAELTEYLRSQNLALVVSRNVTVRDRNDRQQPTNLRIVGGSAASIPNSGKVYDLAQLQFFQGDLIRGYGSNGSGRRVLAQRMHTVEDGVNPTFEGAPQGTVRLAEDGSMAAFVPARRALTWQLADQTGEAVIRERYWVTFQPGEVRVCSSCHGVNTADHLGNPPPTNPPLALQRLLEHWKSLPAAPLPTPTPTVVPEVPPTAEPSYGLIIQSDAPPAPRGVFSVTASGANASTLKLKVALNGRLCAGSRVFAGDPPALRGRFPELSRARVRLQLLADGSKSIRASTQVRLTRSRRSVSWRRGCSTVLSSLRP